MTLEAYAGLTPTLSLAPLTIKS